MLSPFPFELKKVASNSIDAAHSISRNIAKGYCRRSLKEYLNHLNIALGSCGGFTPIGMLEYWNYGIMGSVRWITPTRHGVLEYSIIPYEGHKPAATKSSVLSVACRISETFANDPS